MYKSCNEEIMNNVQFQQVAQTVHKISCFLNLHIELYYQKQHGKYRNKKGKLLPEKMKVFPGEKHKKGHIETQLVHFDTHGDLFQSEDGAMHTFTTNKYQNAQRDN